MPGKKRYERRKKRLTPQDAAAMFGDTGQTHLMKLKKAHKGHHGGNRRRNR